MTIELNTKCTTHGHVDFVSYSEKFDSAIGSNAHARLLLRTPCGQQLFHEAGIYLADAETVVLSSNRLYDCSGNQSIQIVHIPTSAIPKLDKAKCQAFKTTTLTTSEQEELWSKLEIVQDVGHPLAMPNGASRWKKADGKDAILWCDQGKHNTKAHAGCSSDRHSAMVSYDLEGNRKIELDSFEGKKFSSLNDAVLHEATGCIFFTDPDYGVEQLFKRGWSKECYAPNGVYCWQPKTGQVTLLDHSFVKPNGCTFLADPNQPIESGKGLLLVTETGRLRFNHERDSCGNLQAVFVDDPTKPACFYAYPVGYSARGEDGLPFVDVKRRKLVAHSTCGAPDGIHVDESGNVWAGHGDGIHAYAIDWTKALASVEERSEEACGTLIGKIVLPDHHGVANFCWAGKVDDGYRLLLFAEDELWEVIIAVNGKD